MLPFDNLDEILDVLKKYPGLSAGIGMEKAMLFVRLATRLKDEILSKQKPEHNPDEPPDTLPANAQEFLGHAVDIPDSYVTGCWDAFRRTVWQRDANDDSVGADAKLFKRYGLENLLSTRTLFPPTRRCTNPECTKQHTLLRRKDLPRSIVLFTLGEGACPTYSVHLHCHACSTNYHHEYSVKDDVRTYYRGVPDVLEVGDHQFAEREVLNLFTGLMLISWTSATNGARVYNTCLSQPENKPDEWFSSDLRTEHVWDGFCLLSLLEDHAKHDTILSVPHGGLQKDRFKEAMKARQSPSAAGWPGGVHARLQEVRPSVEGQRSCTEM
jgi:hypothetical protein